LDFIRSRSIGCGSAAGLLMEAEGVDGGRVEDGVESRATDCIGVMAGFLGIAA
jgi:hypothetical protein